MQEKALKKASAPPGTHCGAQKWPILQPYLPRGLLYLDGQRPCTSRGRLLH